MYAGTASANSAGGTYKGVYCAGWGSKGRLWVDFEAPNEAPSGVCTVVGHVYWQAVRGYDIAGGWEINVYVAGQLRQLHFPGMSNRLNGGTAHHIGDVSWYLQCGPGFAYSASIRSDIWFTWFPLGSYDFRQSPGVCEGSGTCNLNGVVVQKYYYYSLVNGSWQKRTPKKLIGGQWKDGEKWKLNGSWQEGRL